MTRHIKKRLVNRMALKFRLLEEFIEENLGKESARAHRRSSIGGTPGGEAAVARRKVEKLFAVPEELLGKEPKSIAVIGASAHRSIR